LAVLQLDLIMKRVFLAAIVGLGAIAGVAMPSEAASFKNLVVDFSEYAFPRTTTALTGNPSYNLLNDQTGAKLVADNLPDDEDDFTIEYSSTTPSANSRLEMNNAKVVSIRQFPDKVQKNNPGTLISTTAKLFFSQDWQITDLQAQFTSLNTSGMQWEYSVLGFLRPDGTLFSQTPTIGPYEMASGLTGSPSLGWYVAADKTVQGVGTSKTISLRDGKANDLKLTYALAGLAPNTAVGGLVWTTYLEDVRGLNNAAGSPIKASWVDFTISGSSRSIAPSGSNGFVGDLGVKQVPGPGGLLGVVYLLGLSRWRRR
jgi:hypothetical protein